MTPSFPTRRSSDLPADEDEEQRDVEDREDRRGQHPADHRSADRDAAVRARAGRDRERQHAEDEREARHQDRAKPDARGLERGIDHRSEEHTSELQSLMRISYAVFCLKKKKNPHNKKTHTHSLISNTII